MARRSSTAALGVWMNGDLVGTWKVTPSRGHEFSYDGSWVEKSTARPISLSLPLRPSEPYRGPLVSNFFENLLPDNRAIRERVRTRFAAPSTRAFDLLTEIGRDCVGAIQLLPQGDKPEGLNTIEATPLSAAEIAQILRSLTIVSKDGNDEEFRISIAGAQEKTALLRQDDRWFRPRGTTPTTHILKLALGIVPSGIDLSTSIENEWLCSKILGEYGIEAADSSMERFEDQAALVVTRFDRKRTDDKSWWMRLPQEDIAQATGTPPEQKYEYDGGPGIKPIMDLLLGSQNAETDRRRFFKTQIAFWMLGAIDGHAKNFSVFIQRQGRFVLTPGYDVMSAYPVMGKGQGKIAFEKAKMAMAVWGKNRHYKWAEIRRSHFGQSARDCGLGDAANDIIDELVERTATVVDKVSGKLPPNFPAGVADSIFGGLKAAGEKLASQKADT